MISIHEILYTFAVLFAIIDVTGAIPIVINIKHQGMTIKPFQIALTSFAVLAVFLIGGEQLLSAAKIDIHGFALAGAIILLVYALEMTLGVHIMNNTDCPQGASAVIPLVFPLIAGAGAMTSVIAMRTEYAMINILIAIFLNMVVVFFVLKYIDKLEKIIGPQAIYVITKVLGIVLLATASRMFVENLKALAL